MLRTTSSGADCNIIVSMMSMCDFCTIVIPICTSIMHLAGTVPAVVTNDVLRAVDAVTLCILQIRLGSYDKEGVFNEPRLS